MFDEISCSAPSRAVVTKILIPFNSLFFCYSVSVLHPVSGCASQNLNSELQPIPCGTVTNLGIVYFTC